MTNKHKGDLLRDLAVRSDGGWSNCLCEAGVLRSSAGVQVPRTGSQDVTSGKQGHASTLKDGLESALVSQHFQTLGPSMELNLSTPDPRAGQAEAEDQQGGAGTVGLRSPPRCKETCHSFTSAFCMGSTCLLASHVRSPRGLEQRSDL